MEAFRDEATAPRPTGHASTAQEIHRDEVAADRAGVLSVIARPDCRHRQDHAAAHDIAAA
ncbi:hypothetical protein [uncultured Pseudacidovorax sp.]|nr:hypothetical protein [uncultured Pseudacidovorax sp.]